MQYVLATTHLWTNYLSYIYSFVLKRILKDINSFCFYFYLRKFFYIFFKIPLLKDMPDPWHPVLTFDFLWQHVTTCDISNHWEIVYMYILKLPKLGIILCSAILTKYSFSLLTHRSQNEDIRTHQGFLLLWMVINNKVFLSKIDFFFCHFKNV